MPVSFPTRAQPCTHFHQCLLYALAALPRRGRILFPDSIVVSRLLAVPSSFS